jgi:hypothetical protein
VPIVASLVATSALAAEVAKGEALELSPDISALIVRALSKEAKEPVQLVVATRERRNDGEVTCGFYAPSTEQAHKTARPFSWSSGKLVMTWGPDWNIGTLCLISNYDMPLP